MFSKEILEKIRNNEEVVKVPLVFQCAMIHAIQEVLDKERDGDGNANEQSLSAAE